MPVDFIWVVGVVAVCSGMIVVSLFHEAAIQCRRVLRKIGFDR